MHHSVFPPLNAKMAKTGLVKHIPFLKYCACSSPKDRKKILKSATKDQIRSLCEVTLNVAKKNVHVPAIVKQRLCNHKKAIRIIADRKGSLLKKKKTFIQSGGFLPILLKTVLPIIASSLFVD